MGSREQRTAAAKAWRHLYRTAAWQALRRAAFHRDNFICQICGKGVVLNPKHPHSAVGDHIKPHKGDLQLFYDLANVRTLGRSCHDRHAQREAHGTARPQIGDDGWPT